MFQFPVSFWKNGIMTLTISANTVNFNLSDFLGNPATPVSINLTIASGVYIYSTDTAIPAFTTGSLPVGSNVKITNRGYILGMGGKGEDGAQGTSTAGAGGSAPAYCNGGNALNISLPITIDNTSGFIGGGGGGGASGPAPSAVTGGGGGGAGGGAGGNGSHGALGGIGGLPGLAGSNGAMASGGNVGGLGGGAGGGGASWSNQDATIPRGGGGGAGGRILPGTGGNSGGFYGGHGGSGSNSGVSYNATNGYPEVGGGGGWGANGGRSFYRTNGGLGGKAINLNGHIITFTGGNIPSRVMGAVS